MKTNENNQRIRSYRPSPQLAGGESRRRKRHPVCTAPIWALGYSTDWAQGGPIIEREVIVLTHPKYDCWTATGQDPTDLDVPLYQEDGPTPLIAAMRCYVASKLGHKVEIPDELYERKTND
jgi:hypothetical protein